MRILFLSTWFPHPPDNGSKIRVYHLLRALGERHQVTLVSFAFGTADPERAAAALPFCQAVHALQRNPFDRAAPALATRYLSPAPVVTRSIPEMQRLVQTETLGTPFDVVIASTEVVATYAREIPAALPRILEEHNSLSRMMEDRYRATTNPFQRLSRWISWQKTRRYEASLFHRFDRIVMVSEQDRRTCQSLPGCDASVDVIPNGVDCAHHRPGLARVQPHTLVYNGALTYPANYDAMHYFLGEIYPDIRRHFPRASLIITGSTQGVDTTALRLDDSVRLTGYLDDIRPLVAGSAVCVVPLRQGGGTRIKILEAMALGTPVVATSKGAEGLEVVDGEHLLLADDPEAFAHRTAQLLRDPTLRRRLAFDARRRVEERYDWGQIGQRFVELVDDAVDRAGRRR
jgi:glycosyltransferase involved in cell wall biosynthesis